MNYKANYKILIAGHLIGIVLLSIVWFFVAVDGRFILKLILATLIFSLIVQVVIYKIKPEWFNDKVSKQPDQF